MKNETIKLEKCSSDQLDSLAAMNLQLIEDENADNPMDLAQLRERMEAFLESEYRAYLFVAAEEAVGYALIRMTASPYYLRHFFVCREHRRKHFGEAAFHAILQELDTDTMDLDVFVWNSRGLDFWKSLGFQERCSIMRFQKKQVSGG